MHRFQSPPMYYLRGFSYAISEVIASSIKAARLAVQLRLLDWQYKYIKQETENLSL